jgi:hypothetical protein
VKALWTKARALSKSTLCKNALSESTLEESALGYLKKRDNRYAGYKSRKELHIKKRKTNTNSTSQITGIASPFIE